MASAIWTVPRGITSVLLSRKFFQLLLWLSAIGFIAAAFWFAAMSEPTLSWWAMIYGVSVLGFLVIIAN